MTPPAVSVHIAAFHLWQLIAECGGKGTYAKAAQPRCLLANPITCPPSEREGLIHGQGGARLSPSPHPAGMLLPVWVAGGSSVWGGTTESTGWTQPGAHVPDRSPSGSVQGWQLLCSTAALEERERLNRSAGRATFHHCCLQGICWKERLNPIRGCEARNQLSCSPQHFCGSDKLLSMCPVNGWSYTVNAGVRNV